MLSQVLPYLVICLFRHSVVNIKSRINQKRQIGSVRRGGIRGSVNLVRVLREGPTAEGEECCGGR